MFNSNYYRREANSHLERYIKFRDASKRANSMKLKRMAARTAIWNYSEYIKCKEKGR